MLKVMSIFGTRPEAIKMAPVVKTLEDDERIESLVLVTAQHREMLDQVLDVFDIAPDYDLNIMTQGQTLAQITTRVIAGVTEVFEQARPDVVLVHGDTTTTFAAALAAFYQGIKVGHIEAGMRTGDLHRPFPEELNRTLVADIATWHFAPSQECAHNLLKEGVSPEAIVMTPGNTGIAALLLAQKRINAGLVSTGIQEEADGRRHILVTAHRRESWGAPMQGIFDAIRTLSLAHPEIVFDVATHANPVVAKPAQETLGNLENVCLRGPQGYADFIHLMARASLIMTDSGGIQEEGPTLGVPVMVLRDKTEYHELLDAGVVYLAGTDTQNIITLAERLLQDEAAITRSRDFARDRAKAGNLCMIPDAIRSCEQPQQTSEK